jgi:hypothetical protein
VSLRVFVSGGLAIIKNDFAIKLMGVERRTAWPFNAKRRIWTQRIGMVGRQTADRQRYSTPVSRRFAATERDQKGRRVFAYVGMYVCMYHVYVCRGGIIDSPPGLKTSSSPFISILSFPFLPAFTFSTTSHTNTPTLFLFSTVSTSTSPCSSESCAACTAVQLDRNT